MAIKAKLLNGNVINRDTDLSKYIETVSEPWVITWLAVSSSSVAVWKARVPCERENWENLYVLVTVSTPVNISWNGDVFIKVNQNLIDNWELANEDWTWIATIEVWTMPNKNALKLASISSGIVTDKRNMIKKVWELYEYITIIQWQVSSMEQQIDFLTNESASSLKEAWLVGENYTLWDDIFRQKTPEYNNCTTDYYVWNSNDNKEVHIQRLWSWIAGNKIYLKVKSVWSPTTWLTVEVRKWVVVDVSDEEAYWYWDEVVCSWTISYSWITSDYQMFEVDMDSNFWGTRWEILDVVIYQTWSIVNASNYYSIACDWSQYSEWFSLVAVNGTTRTRSRYCPYCIADWFEWSMICKTVTAVSVSWTSLTTSTTRTWTDTESYTTTQSYSTLYLTMSFNCTSTEVWSSSSDVSGIWKNDWSVSVSVWWNTVMTQTISRTQSESWWNITVKLSNVASWTTITLSLTNPWYWTNSRPWVTYYYIHSVSASLSITPNQNVIIKPLKPVEVKAIWQQAYWISYWRLSDWTRYWEFSWETYESATTWSITLWNCLWFKVITDSNWESYKIPIYWL